MELFTKNIGKIQNRINGINQDNYIDDKKSKQNGSLFDFGLLVAVYSL